MRECSESKREKNMSVIFYLEHCFSRLKAALHFKKKVGICVRKVKENKKFLCYYFKRQQYFIHFSKTF